MSIEPDDPTDPSHTDAAEAATDGVEAAGEAQGGLVDAGAAEEFNDAVERRMADRSTAGSSPGNGTSDGAGLPELEEEEDSSARPENS